MTEAELAAVRARYKDTLGPGADRFDHADSGRDVPALLAEVDRLRRVEAFLRPVADRVEACELALEEAEKRVAARDDEQGFMTAEIARLRAALEAACSGSDEDAFVNKCPEVYRALRGEA